MHVVLCTAICDFGANLFAVPAALPAATVVLIVVDVDTGTDGAVLVGVDAILVDEFDFVKEETALVDGTEGDTTKNKYKYTINKKQMRYTYVTLSFVPIYIYICVCV